MREHEITSSASDVRLHLMRSRLLGFLSLGVVVWAVHAVTYLAMHRAIIGGANAFAAISFCLLLAVAWRTATSAPRVEGMLHLGLAIACVALCVAAYGAGLGPSMPVWYLVLVPLAAAYAISLRASIAWSVIGLIAMSLVHLVERLHPRPPEFVPHAVELLLGQASLLVVASSLAAMSRRIADARLEELERRSAMLAQRAVELDAARNAALAAVEAKSEFLATMSHELRTPLHAVLGAASMLGTREMDAASTPLVETIRHSGGHLKLLVDDLLSIARLDATTGSVGRAPTRMADLIASVFSVLRIRSEEKGLALGSRMTLAVPEYVSLDESRIRQVLVNLVGNAIKFTEVGEVSVEVDFDPDESRLTLSVIDSGCGVAPEGLATLFDPFTQFGPRRSHAEGVGLGLSIVRKIVGQMGGDVTVDSVPNVGSCFTVSIPAVGAFAPASTPRKTLSVARSRVLIVDDNATNRMIAERMVSLLGHEASCASGGAAALELIRHEHFDLMLLDIRMPDLDGHEVARRVRSLGSVAADLRIIAFSASSTLDDVVGARAAGVDGFLPKPLTLEELEAAIGRVVLAPTAQE